jgi:tetratricopeptide (TPR) repeat protein
MKTGLLVGAAIVAFAVGLTVTRTRAARRDAPGRPAVAATVAKSLTPTATLALAALPESPPTPPKAEPSTTDDAPNESAVAECNLLCRHHRWRQAAEPCALAVKARPDDASIVLGLAQAEHARDRLAEAAEWARRAIALDPSLAEAFIIQAHAEARAGHSAAAARDFRRYLALAPRGWHAREAREALHAVR